MSSPQNISAALLSFTSEIRKEIAQRPQFKFNMDECLLIIKEIGKAYIGNKFTIDEDNEYLYTELVKYFMGDPTYEGDLRKGILIEGPTGRGKSYAFLVFKKFMEFKGIQQGFKIEETINVASDFELSGYEGIKRYCSHTKLFNDLGKEPLRVQHYGTNINVMEYLINKRYDDFVTKGLRTHITTNLSYEQIASEEWYGERIESRLHEMFNHYILEGKDRRK